MPTLDWIGKRAVLNHHREIPFRLLECVPELSVGDPDSGNLLVQGDNLQALKALLPYYAGKVKCIYIDPPYNTGNEKWVYNDNVNSPEIRKWLGEVVGKEAEDLSRHDKWLCMMYPRLALLRDFLTEDGAIFVSIDRHELQNLLAIADEVFGERNWLATLTWEKGKKGDGSFFSENHEQIVAFARNRKLLEDRKEKWRKRKAGADAVLAHYQSLRQELGAEHSEIRTRMMAWYRSLPAQDPRKQHKHYNWSDSRGLYFPDNFAGPDDGRETRPRYEIIHPVTGRPCKKPSTGWRWDEDTTKRALAEDPPRIHFGATHATIPNRKSYLAEIDTEPFPTVFYKDGRAATLHLEGMLGEGKFAFPKDVEILADLFSLILKDGDILLDSFAGSGASAHALLSLASRQRKKLNFVAVELEPSVFDEVTVPRLRKAVQGYVPVKPPGAQPIPALGGGFRVCRLGEPLFDHDGRIRESVNFADLGSQVFFSETGTPASSRPAGRSPLIGVFERRAIYLLFNGVLGDKRPAGGNVLTREVLEALPPHDGPKVVYGEACRLGAERLKRADVTFKQVPYEIRVG